jgi:hypothetical protein
MNVGDAIIWKMLNGKTLARGKAAHPRIYRGVVKEIEPTRVYIVQRDGTIRNVEPTHRLPDAWIETARMTRVAVIRSNVPIDVVAPGLSVLDFMDS